MNRPPIVVQLTVPIADALSVSEDQPHVSAGTPELGHPADGDVHALPRQESSRMNQSRWPVTREGQQRAAEPVRVDGIEPQFGPEAEPLLALPLNMRGDRIVSGPVTVDRLIGQ